jgi:hypothetical protein
MGNCRTTCSSQCNQKTDLMEETRQYIYTPTLSLTCGFFRPKRGPKWVAIYLFHIASAGSWTQDLLALIPCRTACSSQCNQNTDQIEETRQYIYTSIEINPAQPKGPQGWNPSSCGRVRCTAWVYLALDALHTIGNVGSSIEAQSESFGDTTHCEKN